MTNNFLVRRAELDQVGFWPKDIHQGLKKAFFSIMEIKPIPGTHWYSLGALKEDLAFFMTDPKKEELQTYLLCRKKNPIPASSVYLWHEGCFKEFKPLKELAKQYNLTEKITKRLVTSSAIPNFHRFYSTGDFEKIYTEHIEAERKSVSEELKALKKRFEKPKEVEKSPDLKSSSFASAKSLTDFFESLEKALHVLTETVETQNEILKELSGKLSLKASSTIMTSTATEENLTKSEGLDDLWNFVLEKSTLACFKPSVELNTLYDRYIKWCKSKSKKFMIKHSFSRALTEDLGLSRFRRRGIKHIGLGISFSTRRARRETPAEVFESF